MCPKPHTHRGEQAGSQKARCPLLGKFSPLPFWFLQEPKCFGPPFIIPAAIRLLLQTNGNTKSERAEEIKKAFCTAGHSSVPPRHAPDRDSLMPPGGPGLPGAGPLLRCTHSDTSTVSTSLGVGRVSATNVGKIMWFVYVKGRSSKL